MRSVMATCVAVATLAAAPQAQAWYFPEHVAVAKDALAPLPAEIRAVLEEAIARGIADGLPLCPRAAVGLEDVARTRPLKTRMLRAEKGVDCIPYAALPALGGDHSGSVEELRRVVASGKGIEVTTAAAYQWRRFLQAIDRLPNTPLERMSFVHALDVDFYFIDPGYEIRAGATRSHFVDAGRSVDDVLRDTGLAGAVDNAVGQFFAHHLRSLQLAARGQKPDAILEHGLALHFLEDAFSAGHLVMKGSLWARGNTYARHRHDYFDAKGLRVRRAASTASCAELEKSLDFGGTLTPCWATTGDGHLGLTPDASDRVHLSHAVKKTEVALAMAFDPERVVRFAEALDAREQIAFGALFDPAPWWTLPKGVRKKPATATDAMRLVHGAARAADRLRTGPITPAVVVGRRSDGALFDPEFVNDAVAPCPDEDRCALGTVGVSFLRPMLVEFPAAEESDVSRLTGQAMTDHGMAYQLVTSIGGGALLPSGSSVDFFAPAVGAAGGLAYRFGTYLPGRQNRSLVELNVGVNLALHFDSRFHAGGNPTATMLEQELRWPILWELLTSYIRPFDLHASHSAGRFILLGGVRAREFLGPPVPKFWGFEVEAAALEILPGIGSYPLYGGSVEARLYLGVADPSVAQPSSHGPWGPTIGLALASGYSTFF